MNRPETVRRMRAVFCYIFYLVVRKQYHFDLRAICYNVGNKSNIAFEKKQKNCIYEDDFIQ